MKIPYKFYTTSAPLHSSCLCYRPSNCINRLLYTPAIATMLHMNSGRVRLSFWSDNASKIAEITATEMYRATCRQVSVHNGHIPNSGALNCAKHTENASRNPARRRKKAAMRIETTNARLPSRVFDVVADHRWTPSRLPTIEA